MNVLEAPNGKAAKEVYRPTKVGLSELTHLLNAVITKVFDNEERFMRDVYRPGGKFNAELHEFYMASERCRITFIDTDGMTLTDTVRTQDVLDWAEGI